METPVLPCSGGTGGSVIEQPAAALPKKKKKKRALKEIEVTEGVDMFKEHIADERKKDKSSHALRAMPKKTETMNVQEVVEAEREKRSKAHTDRNNGGGAPRPRGRAPNGTNVCILFQSANMSMCVLSRPQEEMVVLSHGTDGLPMAEACTSPTNPTSEQHHLSMCPC